MGRFVHSWRQVGLGHDPLCQDLYLQVPPEDDAAKFRCRVERRTGASKRAHVFFHWSSAHSDT